MLTHMQEQRTAAMALGKDGMLADASTINSGGVVQVEVKVVEFNKTAMKQIGINFQNRNGGFAYGFARPGTGLPGNTGLLPGMKEGNSSNEAVSPISSAFRLVFGSTKGLWNADVELLQSNGMARVLAEPTLVALSGQSASFLAGGELPILEPQGLGTTTITYKPFGIGLTVTPTVLAPNRIALKVAPEASDLDYSNAIVLNNVQIPRSPPVAPILRSSWAMGELRHRWPGQLQHRLQRQQDSTAGRPADHWFVLPQLRLQAPGQGAGDHRHPASGAAAGTQYRTAAAWRARSQAASSRMGIVVAGAGQPGPGARLLALTSMTPVEPRPCPTPPPSRCIRKDRR